MKISNLIILVLLVAVIALVLTSKQNTQHFEQNEKVLKAQLDSVKALQHKADVEAILALTDLEVAKNQIREQSRITEKYKLRYETLRHTAAPNLTDEGIDSALARLYPIR